MNKPKRQRKSRRGRPAREQRLDAVVGYFAYCGRDVACDGPACLIAGSRKAMLRFLEQAGWADAGYTVRATTAAEVVQGLQMGGAYAFDEQAYGRFLPPARQAGLPLSAADFTPDSEAGGVRLMRLQLPAASYADDEGFHLLSAGAAPDPQTLDKLTQAYQQQVRQSPLWDSMVSEFGLAEAERMLQDFRAELREP